MNLLERPYWVFDLDGTITKPILDFPAIKRRLGLPIDRGILEEISKMPPHEAESTHKLLAEIEREYAMKAEAAPGVAELLDALAARHVTMGILTRNKKDLAILTLEVTGFSSFFQQDFILGRDEAEHKPSPEGLLKLLDAWQCSGSDAVMVGDFLFDLQAGHEAGMATLYVDETEAYPHEKYADRCVQRLDDILQATVKSL